jgi:acetyl-CoA C-acetyltransferase
MTEQVAVLSTWQSEFKLRHPSMTYVEQAQEAAAGCMAKVGMCPDDVDAIVYSLAPTAFMGVADADRWAIDHIFGAGKPMLRVHTGGATGGSVVQAAHALVRSGMYRTVMIVGAERISETPDAQKVLNQIFDPFYEKDMPLQTITAVALMEGMAFA